MGQEYLYCSRCQTRLSGADFEKGSAARISNYVYCTKCLTPEEKDLLTRISKPAPAHTSSTRKQPAVKIKAGSSTMMPRVPGGGGEPKKLKPAILWGSVVGGVLVIIVLVAVLMSGKKEAPPPLPPEAPPAAVAPPKPVTPPPQPVDSMKADLDAVQAEVNPWLERKDFVQVQAAVDRAKGKRTEPEWPTALAAFERSAQELAKTRYKAIQEAAAKSMEKKAVEELRTARREIEDWGKAFGSLLQQFDAEFGSAMAAPAPEPPKPEPEPAKPPEPAVKLAADPRSAVATKYLAAWKKAMEYAWRRNFERAGVELKAAGSDYSDDEVRKENAGDQKDLELLQKLHGDMAKAVAAIPALDEVTIEIIKDDGSRQSIRTKVLQAGPRRLELQGEPRYVELEDITPSSLAKLYVSRSAGKLSPEDLRSAAYYCALDGDETGVASILDGKTDLLAPKVRNLAATVRATLPAPNPEARKREGDARKLFYEAENDFRFMDSRAAAFEKYEKLLSLHGETEFVRANRADIAGKSEGARHWVFGGLGMRGKGVLGIGKLQASIGKDKFELIGWKSKEDPASDDATSAVEVTFYALPNTEYKAMAFLGGCCTTTFTWFLQSTELTYKDKKSGKVLQVDPNGSFAAPWEIKIKGLSAVHGGKGHAKAEKEPVIWEWVEIPMPKYSAPGLKMIRFMPAAKGMAVGAVVISSKDAKVTPEETKKIAAASLEEGVPTNQLRAGKGEADLLLLIPEARQYTLVYDLDLAKLKKPVVYDVDRHGDITKPFDRIAYLVELQKAGAPGQYVFVSMDAFTTDASKIGIPDVGTKFQTKVGAMNVHSNVEGFATGMNLDGGNIEFWSNNYGPQNSAGIPGAANDIFDFGDGASDPVDGYGSMQVHNYKAGLTLFAINQWRAGAGADLGIGNSTGKTKDWTFTGSAGSYSYKRLRILVRPKA